MECVNFNGSDSIVVGIYIYQQKIDTIEGKKVKEGKIVIGNLMMKEKQKYK